MPALSNIEEFISRWTSGQGGQERANYTLFLIELCDLIGVGRPQPADKETALNAYVFERAVTFREPDGKTSNGRIDLYKRGCFVLEAKQSLKRKALAESTGVEATLFPDQNLGAAQKQNGKWDVLMRNARSQAENYAKALPVSEGWPPFLLVCDVGNCIELYADFSGQGKNYAQFPDRKSFRVTMNDLHKPDVRERLRLIWQDPQALDPTKRSAKVTRDIASRLAKVSKHLEELRDDKGRRLHDPEEIALFLMRCLFTMFAEDVGLLPEKGFRSILERCVAKPESFQHMVGQLWAAMDKGDFAYALETTVKKFNGYLFKERAVPKLRKEEIGELMQAASADWREVEPAIFGTLLEQALDPTERKRLGAHYTPRSYVERLVAATVMEPLRRKWEEVQVVAEKAKARRDGKGAIAAVAEFHQNLCATRVLDPACGTGNFLYVALEMMKRLEGDVLEALNDLGGQEALTGLESHTIDPHQFLGLELNPRAKAIAELVIWIGYLQWYFRTQSGDISEPILKDFRVIKQMDAVLAYDSRDLARDDNGRPVTQTDAHGQTIEVYTYKNPRLPPWPETEYVIGNPPFIGGKDIRGRLGDGYAEALWKAHAHVNESADFVMYWWDRAADLLTRKGTKLKRFGFVTTNSITQEFSRRVMARHMKAKKPISLLMAIPDHPWTKATRDAAAVRIAMTVAEAGSHEGVLLQVICEAELDTDSPAIDLSETRGTINPDLTVGADVTAAVPLKANDYICSPGVKLHGSGFIVTPQQAEALGFGRRPGLEQHIRPYRNGRDLVGVSRGAMVIDLFGLQPEEIRKQFPEVYQHLLVTVRSAREAQYKRSPTQDAESYLEHWWVHGKPRQELRKAIAGLERYIATVETAKHRVFQFLDAEIRPDNKLICIGLSDPYYLGVLMSQVHECWYLGNAGHLGLTPVYVKTTSFEPFPFPVFEPELATQIRTVAEELDAFRKQRQAEHPLLTLTQMYNVLEKLRAGAPLDAEDERIRDQGLVHILKELHDRLDALVFEAYGWPSDLSDQEILARLVALNKERAEEEKRGLIRWLRPEYQKARAGIVEEAPKERQSEMALVSATEKEQKPLFPAGEAERVGMVMLKLGSAPKALDAAALAALFRNGRTALPAIVETLAAMERMGFVAKRDNEYYLPQRAA